MAKRIPKKTTTKKVTKEEDSIIDYVNKTYGKGKIFKLPEKNGYEPKDFINSGSLCLNYLITGDYRCGFPRRKPVEIFGQESCIDKDTFVKYYVVDNNTGKTINYKGGSIERLYERFHLNNETGIKRGLHLRNNNVNFFISSINEKNRVIKSKIFDVVKCGLKQVYQVIDNFGNEIVCTEDHKFYTDKGFITLSSLKINDYVYIHNNTHFKNEIEKKLNRNKNICIKYHPYGSNKIIGGKYIFYRKQKSHLYYEAHINNMSYDEYVYFLNNKSKKEINKLKFINKREHIHHEDENVENNEISNLILISPSSHGKYHAKKNHNNLRFVCVRSKIIKIEKLKKRMTYDIKCHGPYHNYIANGFVVHNCGKSTLALSVAYEATKQKQKTLYCDAEKGLNEFYAKQIGIDRKYFYYFLSDFGEEAFTISDDLLKKFDFDLYVFDSIGGMRTRSVVEGDYDKKNMGDHAKLCGNAMIKMAPIFLKKNIAPIIINQLGKKIGEYGNPNDTKGGKTLKFQLWARLELSSPRSQKVEETVKKSGSLEDLIKVESEEVPEGEEKTKKKKSKTETVETGIIINVKTIKNKLFMPRRMCRLKLIYGKGFDKDFDLLEFLDMQGIAKRVTAKKISYNGQSGLNSSFVKKYHENEDFKKEIWEKIEDHRKSVHKVEEDENFLD